MWERTSSSADNGGINKGEQRVEQKTLKKIFAPGPVSMVRGSSPLDWKKSSTSPTHQISPSSSVRLNAASMKGYPLLMPSIQVCLLVLPWASLFVWALDVVLKGDQQIKGRPGNQEVDEQWIIRTWEVCDLSCGCFSVVARRAWCVSIIYHSITIISWLPVNTFFCGIIYML